MPYLTNKYSGGSFGGYAQSPLSYQSPAFPTYTAPTTSASYSPSSASYSPTSQAASYNRLPAYSSAASYQQGSPTQYLSPQTQQAVQGFSPQVLQNFTPQQLNVYSGINQRMTQPSSVSQPYQSITQIPGYNPNPSVATPGPASRSPGASTLTGQILNQATTGGNPDVFKNQTMPWVSPSAWNYISGQVQGGVMPGGRYTGGEQPQVIQAYAQELGVPIEQVQASLSPGWQGWQSLYPSYFMQQALNNAQPQTAQPAPYYHNLLGQPQGYYA